MTSRSFSIANTSCCPTNLSSITSDVTGVPNTTALENYFEMVYGQTPEDAPDVSDMTFLWAHLIGNLESWAKIGLGSDVTTFRWNNQPLPPPSFPSYSFPNIPPSPGDITLGLTQLLEYWQEQADSIVNVLPRENTIWTPDWFTYPQASVNRYNPRYWNQYYFNFMSQFSQTPAYSVIQENVTFEVSNTGGPAPNDNSVLPQLGTQTYFFYMAKGSGIKMTVPRVLFAMNKVHAMYINRCRNTVPNSGVPGGPTLTQAQLQTILSDMTVELYAKGLMDQILGALMSPDGFWKMPAQLNISQVINFISPGGVYMPPATTPAPPNPVEGGLYNSSTDPVQNAPAPVRALVGGVFLWQTLNYLVGRGFDWKPQDWYQGGPGVSPYPNMSTPPTLNSWAATASPYPQPNVSIQANCPATNANPGSADPTNYSRTAKYAWEYVFQVATNLTVVDNILDAYVNEAMLNQDCQAVCNLSQWNALGGWTVEIPSYFGSIAGGTAPTLTTSFGCELLPEWWTGNGGILGINSYTEESDCPLMSIAGLFLD